MRCLSDSQGLRSTRGERRRKLVLLGVVVAAFAALVGTAAASHSWNGYHWARTANTFTLKLGDNVSSAWDSYLGTTSSDWSTSVVLSRQQVGQASDQANGLSGRHRPLPRTDPREDTHRGQSGLESQANRTPPA